MKTKDGKWTHDKYMWVVYEDENQTKIKQMLADLPGIQYPEEAVKVIWKEEEFPERTPEEKYIQYLTINSIEDLFRLADEYDRTNRKPVYRGQSYYPWALETNLERHRSDFLIKDVGLERYELKVFTDAQRRFHEFFSELPDEDDYLSWLALLRHRGTPTRLLDVTRSIYIACYFAIRNCKPNFDAALWIFSTYAINNSFLDWNYGAREDWIRKPIYTVASYDEDVDFPFPKNIKSEWKAPDLKALRSSENRLDYIKTVDAAMRGFIEKPGIAFVEPFWLTRRIDFQQGAFLLPFNVRYGFEENLLFSLNIEVGDVTSERNIPYDVDELFNLKSRAKVIKLRIPAKLHQELKIKLESMNIRDLTLFPDVDGALSHLASFIPKNV